MAGPGHLKLHAPEVPSSYRGRIYFVLGPGMGDTVNDFRILHEVLARYPNATPVVYADPRWKALYPLVPELAHLPIRFHQPAPSGENRGEDAETPYQRTFHNILQEISSENSVSSGLVALGGFKCLDQLARTESGISMKARAIGLPLSPDQCRPWLQLPDEVVVEAQQFLAEQGLRPNQFLAIAPHTFPDKMWSHEAWENLVMELWPSTNLPVLVLGVGGYPPIRGKRVFHALGLPLPLVAGLLSQACGFVGLDSGLTHLAACFDVPIVTLNPQGKYPPFLIEAHSPDRWTHLTPGVYGKGAIRPESVFHIVVKALEREPPPRCLLCNSSPYVLEATGQSMLFFCRCGLMYRTRVGSEESVSPSLSSGPSMALPTLKSGLRNTLVQLNTLSREAMASGEETRYSVIFEHWDPVQTEPQRLLEDPTDRELWWTWDAAYRFLHRAGWDVVGSSLTAPAGGRCSVATTMQVAPHSHAPQDVMLGLPWGQTAIRVRRSLYERWLSWGAFRKQNELEGLGWRLAKEGNHEGEWTAAETILRLAFRVSPGLKTLSRLLRVRVMKRKPTSCSGVV